LMEYAEQVLIEAVKTNKVARIDKLLTYAAVRPDLSSEGRTLFTIASINNQLPTLNALIDGVLGGSPDDDPDLLLSAESFAPINQQDDFGETPLLVAMERGHDLICHRLISIGADATWVNEGENRTIAPLVPNAIIARHRFLFTPTIERWGIIRSRQFELKHEIIVPTTPIEGDLLNTLRESFARLFQLTLAAFRKRTLEGIRHFQSFLIEPNLINLRRVKEHLDVLCRGDAHREVTDPFASMSIRVDPAIARGPFRFTSSFRFWVRIQERRLMSQPRIDAIHHDV